MNALIRTISIASLGLTLAMPALAGGDDYDAANDTEGKGPAYFGFVRDNRGSPVADARVVLRPKSGEPVVLKTNVLGLYRSHVTKEVAPDDVESPARRPATSRRSVVPPHAARRDRHAHRDQLHACSGCKLTRCRDRRAASACSLLGHLALAGCALRARPGAPDTILLNGKIVRYDARARRGAGGARRHDRGARQTRPTSARSPAPAPASSISAAAPSSPGLIDSHIHAIRAGLTFTTEVHWIGARTLAEALDRIRAAAQAAPKGAWLIVAGGWTERQFAEGRRPTQAEIAAAAPDHHVYVQLFYSRVLLDRRRRTRRSASRSDADLAGAASIERDARRQADRLAHRRQPRHQRSVRPAAAPDLRARRSTARARFFRALNAVGLTGVIDPGGYNLSIPDYQPLFEVWRERALTVRVRYSLCAPRRGHELEDFEELTQVLPMGFGDDWLRFNGIGENVTWGMYNNDTPTRGAEGAALPRCCAGRAARHDRDLPLAQRPLGASPARRAGARQRARRRSRRCAGRSRISTTPRPKASSA